jgi:hypothetical protein
MHSILKVMQTGTVYDLTTVAAANAYLNLVSSPTGDAALQTEITAASRIIATQCDRVFAMEDVTETFITERPGECILVLKLDRNPVITFTSIDINGQALTPDQYDVDFLKGMVRLNYLYWPFGFLGPGFGAGFGTFRMTATYTGGYMLPSNAPPDLALACHALIKEQRFARLRGDPTIRSVEHGDLRIFYQQGTAAVTAGQGALPPSVQQLIAPYKEPAQA